MYKNIEDTLKTQKFLIKEIYIPVPIAVAEGKYIMTESGNSHHYLQKFLSSLLDWLNELILPHYGTTK